MSSRSPSPARPVVALTLGDPAGIGPELIARLLADPALIRHANIVVVGDPWLWQQGQEIAGHRIRTTPVHAFEALRNRIDDGAPAFLGVDTVQAGEIHPGRAGASGGRACLQVLDACMDAALAGHIDAICFAPLNKHAMKLGGLRHEDELHHFAEYLGVTGYFCEFNTLGNLWTSRISSHVPLREAADHLDSHRITQAAELIYRALLANGVPSPRVAIAGFNPHNGEGGTCGREEIEIIEPAVRQLRQRQWPTPDPFHGPFPADTIFLKAQAGDYQAVVTMYHDQGQIAIKLLGFSRGVTVQGGLPIPITTPAHGTAYDIAGRGMADAGATREAFLIACRMGRASLQRRTRTDDGPP